jgi:type I restriction enzyme, S subunit
MELRQGYKLTEVGEIPEEWEVLRIGELLEFKNGLNKASEFFGYGTPIINYMDVFQNRGILKSFINGKVFVGDQEKKTFAARKGDVFFTRTSETQQEIGISAVLLEDINDCVFSGFLLRGRPKNNLVYTEFYQFSFSTSVVRNQIISSSTYTTRALTNGRYLSKVWIPLPTIPEQTAIATALSDMDALVAQTEKLIEKKKAIKQGMMQKLLSPYDIEGKLKEGWKTKPLSEMSWFQEGPGLRNWQFTNQGIKVINVTNLENGILNLERTDRYISLKEFHRMYRHFEIDENDIVVASSGNSYGKIAVVRKQDLPLLMNTSVIRFKPLKDLDYGFLLVFLMSNYFKNQVDQLITGGAQPNFGPAHLNKVQINLPDSIKEQKHISAILSAKANEIQAIENKLDKYRMIKQSMMQSLLTGKIRIYNPDHEPSTQV